jgi:hypothetical protein
MNRVDYLQARLAQLRILRWFPSGFASWLARLELGEAGAGIRVRRHLKPADIVQALIAGRRGGNASK